MKKLSLEYFNESHRAKAPDCETPWLSASYGKTKLDAVGESLKDSLRELASL